jgi:P-type Cu+ transporter
MNSNLVQLGRKKPVEIVIETDVVCGMKVTPESSAGNYFYNGKTYYFCAVGCLNRFKQTPEKYLQPQPTQQVKESTEIEFTCPMHPEIVQIGFGMCPKCGMALEPKTFTLTEDTSESDAMQHRFRVSLAFTLPIFLIAMSEMFAHIPRWSVWIQFVLSIPVVIYGGFPFFERGIDSIKNKSPNMFTLIAIGVGAAFIYSLIALFFPQLFPQVFHSHNGNIGVYFEAAAVIITLVLLGQILELRAGKQTKTALKEILQLSPKSAHVVFDDNTEADLPIDELQIGAKLRVRANEKIPIDGVILSGQSSVDESMISGEAMPIFKETGAKVIGGTFNQQGSFVMQVEKIGRETLLSQIVQMVSEAQRTKAPIQNLADKVATYFVPSVIFTAIFTLIIWTFFGNIVFGFVCAVAVLIIACPCALGLATPMSVVVGTGNGAKNGVLIRNAEALQMLEKIDVLVVDKTGTLTEGKPKITSIKSLDNFTENEVLQIAASLEALSEHPLANAVTREATARNLRISQVENFQSITGKGVSGEIDGKFCKVESGKQKVENAKTTIEVIVNNEVIGVIELTDAIKSSAEETVTELKKLGIEIIMLTGDNKSVADFIAGQIGIEKVFANVLPSDKADIIRDLQLQGKIVAMAGDGVNDAIALTQSNVGIAPANGTDIAVESADIVLINGDLRGILRSINLSKAVMRNIRQNLFFAFAYNLLGVPLAAGLLYPVFGMILSPMIASLAMTFSSVSVIGNALRLRNTKL